MNDKADLFVIGFTKVGTFLIFVFKDMTHSTFQPHSAEHFHGTWKLTQNQSSSMASYNHGPDLCSLNYRDSVCDLLGLLS